MDAALDNFSRGIKFGGFRRVGAVGNFLEMELVWGFRLVDSALHTFLREISFRHRMNFSSSQIVLVH